MYPILKISFQLWFTNEHLFNIKGPMLILEVIYVLLFRMCIAEFYDYGDSDLENASLVTS